MKKLKKEINAIFQFKNINSIIVRVSFPLALNIKRGTESLGTIFLN